jgi:hypothetical protein
MSQIKNKNLSLNKDNHQLSKSSDHYKVISVNNILNFNILYQRN